MKLVRTLLLVSMLSSTMVVMGASSALACSCVAPRPDSEAAKGAAAVFAGTVVESEKGVDATLGLVTWTFDVDTVYKGAVGESEDVTSHTQSAACGFVFEEGKRYVVFTYRDAGELHTNGCLNTRPLGAGEEIELEALSHREPDEATPTKATTEETSGWDPFVVGSLGFVAIFGVLSVVALTTGRRSGD